MKAEELMIDDWCMSSDLTEPAQYSGFFQSYTPFNQPPYKRLRFLYGKNHKSGIGIMDGADIPEFRVDPIPLQKIHLIKNGFECRENTDDTEFFFNDGYEINVNFDEGLPEEEIPPCIFLSIDFAEKNIMMPIEYVHELQHALRLCGINKEITL